MSGGPSSSRRLRGKNSQSPKFKRFRQITLAFTNNYCYFIFVVIFFCVLHLATIIVILLSLLLFCCSSSVREITYKSLPEHFVIDASLMLSTPIFCTDFQLMLFVTRAEARNMSTSPKRTIPLTITVPEDEDKASEKASDPKDVIEMQRF